jgi:hypothetical protein
MNMTGLRLNIGPDRLTVNDAIALEEEAISGMRAMRDFLARFVVDADGQEVSAEEGQALVGGLTITELEQAMQAVNDAFGEVNKDAVDPPRNETS